MKIPIPPDILPTQENLLQIAGVDEFKGEWAAAGGNLLPERLQSLRRIATIESVGSSTRIEGVRLTDDEVEAVLGGVSKESFQTRDEQEVAGYANAMGTVQLAWRDLRLTEGILCQLHGDLLRYSTKDERHRGAWKTLPNNVAAFDADGKEIGIVFETATPFETPRMMEELLNWQLKEETEITIHPLLRIAVFKVAFLAIHPFQDGNGRLSRVLTNLMLLRAGYDFASYSSLESVIEHNKEAYYIALRRTQRSFGADSEKADWQPWIQFFLRAMRNQVGRLRERIEFEKTIVESAPTVKESRPVSLSRLATRLLAELQDRDGLSVAEAAEALAANRNTLKDKFRELVDAGLAELHGKGRGAHYRYKN